MHLEGRIETTNLQEITVSRVTFGLDTAEERRLLDQRSVFELNCQVARINGENPIIHWVKARTDLCDPSTDIFL
jgi:hypothetical protein